MADDITIHQALARVMAGVGAVAKGDRNKQQGFNFRGIDAVVNAVGPVLRQHGVLTLPVVEDVQYETIGTKAGGSMRQCTIRVRWEFHGPAGDHLAAVVMAEATDPGDKATSKAHSVSYRTALLQVLCIPTDEPDPDATSFERAAHRSPATISAEEASAFAAVLNKGGKPARDAWLTTFGVPPADLPQGRLGEASEWITEHLRHAPDNELTAEPEPDPS